MQLDRADLELARPRGHAAEQHSDPWMPCKFRHLCSRHCTHAVATVIQDKPFLAGDTVPAEPEADFGRKRLEHRAVAHRRRRAEDERLRPGNVPARVRIRPAHVPEENVLVVEVLLDPGDVDDGRKLAHCAATTSISAAIDGRSARRATQPSSVGN